MPLDDCLYALQPTIPHLTRSSLHRCLQRHGISRLPDTDGNKPQRSRFKRYPIGFFHIDIAEVRTEQGKLHLFVAIDRTSKFAFVELHEKATRRVAGDFLRRLVAAVPYKINTVLTDNGTHFTDPTGDGWTPEDIRAMRAEGVAFRCHSFEAACADLDIEHRLTKPRHPWTNGQVERMNRTIKDATVKRFHYATHDQLRTHLADFVAAYNFARRLNTLRGLTPCEANGIEHRLTKPNHPWTNGQVERMNRTIKDATTKAFHYPSLEALQAHVLAFVRAYNFAKHLKALRWRTPFQAICDAWTKDPSIFKINPHHLIPGPNT